jgi:hypothetical protein
MSAVKQAGRVAAGVLPAAVLVRDPQGVLALVAAVVFLFVLTLGTVRWVIANDDRTNRVIRIISARHGRSPTQKSPAAPARASRGKPADPPAAPARASRGKPADSPAAPA